MNDKTDKNELRTQIGIIYFFRDKKVLLINKKTLRSPRPCVWVLTGGAIAVHSLHTAHDVVVSNHFHTTDRQPQWHLHHHPVAHIACQRKETPRSLRYAAILIHWLVSLVFYHVHAWRFSRMWLSSSREPHRLCISFESTSEPYGHCVATERPTLAMCMPVANRLLMHAINIVQLQITWCNLLSTLSVNPNDVVSLARPPPSLQFSHCCIATLWCSFHNNRSTCND